MVGDLLRDFQLAAVLQIRRDAGRPKGMIANPRFDAGRFRASADDTVGVLLEEEIMTAASPWLNDLRHRQKPYYVTVLL